ncbi:MAG: type II secretion system F family protein [Defluviitaleaceae bacterium]|nr:type II secretion system F family protein [Defluviitaleaceae bacterium]
MKLNKTELAFFANQLSFLIESKMPLKWGLLHIKNASPKNLKKIIDKLIIDIEAGNKLHESLKGVPSFFTYMIKAGEEAGSLSEVLLKLANHYEKEAIREKELGGLLIYPIFVIFALIAVITLTVTFLVPNFMMFFEEQGVDLPTTTLVLINITDFLQTGIFLTIFIALFIAYVFLRIEKNFLDNILFKLFRKQFIVTFSYRFSIALKIMLSAEVSILKALNISKNMISNSVYKTKLESLIKDVEAGKSLAVCLEEAEIFHYNLIGMVIMGEATGFLIESLEKCSNFLEKEQKQSLERRKKLIEPILTISIGAILFFIMLALMMPTFAIMEVI